MRAAKVMRAGTGNKNIILCGLIRINTLKISGAPCFDRYATSDCETYKGRGYCWRDSVKDVMQVECTKTCGLCFGMNRKYLRNTLLFFCFTLSYLFSTIAILFS